MMGGQQGGGQAPGSAGGGAEGAGGGGGGHWKRGRGAKEFQRFSRLIHTVCVQVPGSGPGVHDRRGAGIVGQCGARLQEVQHHAETHLPGNRQRRGAEHGFLQTQVR